MLFRRRILSSATQIIDANTREGIPESKEMVSDRVVLSIKSDFNNALNYYEKHRKFLNMVTDHWYKESAVVVMQQYATIENLSLEGLSKLLCILAQMKSKVEYVQIAIVQLQKAIEKSIEWSREGIFPTISKLIELNRNLPESVIPLIVHQEHSKELQQAIHKMHSDAKVTEEHAHTMEKYWNGDIHWQKIFTKPAFSYLMTYAISIMSNLEGMTTNDNCNIIYDMHEKGNEPAIYELSKRLTELRGYDKNKRSELNFKIAPFVDLGHKIDLTDKLHAIFSDIRPIVLEYKSPAQVPVDVSLIIPSAPSPPAYDDNVMKFSFVGKEGEPDPHPHVSEVVVSSISNTREINASVPVLHLQGTFRPAPDKKETLVEKRAVGLVVN